jgi:DNA-binding response OmpR family regulator
VRVLIVEDDADQRRVFALVVQAHGHDVVECASISEARAAEPCEVSFVDRNLPDGDGLDLACELAGRVYLLTGDELPDARGVEVLVKPVRPATLDALL